MSYKTYPSKLTIRNKEVVSEKKVCAKHLFSYWGKDQSGKWYANCVAGARQSEPCMELQPE